MKRPDDTDESFGGHNPGGMSFSARRGVFCDNPTQQFTAQPDGRGKRPGEPDEGQPVWAARAAKPPDRKMIRYCAGRDAAAVRPADEALVSCDIWTNTAHVLMLARQGIVSNKTAASIFHALAVIERDHQMGNFKLKPGLEDVHMNIEARVGEIAGDKAAGSMHIGRSRNDQAATDMRLWLRDALLDVEADLLNLVDALLRRAEEWKTTVMPGYTHGQPGMVSTLGYWAAGHAEALLRDSARFRRVCRAIDQCPLGAAAGYGTSWNLDRKATARFLGFSQYLPVGVDCVTNRWEAEADAVGALAFMFNHLSILAQDVIQFSSPPRTFLRLPSQYATGSSIMPQKQNPDFAEVTRAKASALHGHLMGLFSLSKGMISGYNRDTQWTKYMAMDAFREADLACAVFAGVMGEIKPDREAMLAACREGFMNAVEVADYIARSFGADFRAVYKIMGRAAKKCQRDGKLSRSVVLAEMAADGINASISEEEWRELENPVSLVNMRRSEGSPAFDRMDESLAGLREMLDGARRNHADRGASIQRALAGLRKLVRELEVRSDIN